LPVYETETHPEVASHAARQEVMFVAVIDLKELVVVSNPQ